MELQLWPAVSAGLGAGLAMEVPMIAMSAMGVPTRMNIARLWGSMVGLEGAQQTIVGNVVHFAVSAVVGVIYAWVFQLLGITDALWFWGLAGGVAHWAIAGAFMAVLPALHPAVPERMPAPGAFVKDYGMPDVPGFLVGHLLYGVSFGILYAYFTAGLAAAF